MNSNLIYHKEILDYDRLPHQRKIVLEWVGQNKSVLELGCHTGNLSQWLVKNNCSVVGVDVNPDALVLANQFCIQTHLIDLDDINMFEHKIGTQTFDVIVMLHVLEHLKEPAMVLKKAGMKLKKGGQIIIALPNISNARDRLDMLMGKFEYKETGVMDNTHIKFFNYFTAQRLIEESGFTIKNYASGMVVDSAKEISKLFPRYTRTITYRLLKKFVKFSSNWQDMVLMYRCEKL